jgi:hypothetical protein
MPKSVERQGLRAGLWVLIAIGLSLSIMLQVWLGRTDLAVSVGEQPGGDLIARVVDEEGRPVVGHPVELEVWPSGGLPKVYATHETDAEGRVVFGAPALMGKYRLLAGGGSHQRVGRERSFVDEEGSVVEPSETLLELREGVQLALKFTREGGSSVAGGTLWLNATTLDGPLFGLLGAPIELTREFKAEACLLDGLPPLEGVIRVRFLDGTELEFQVLAKEDRVDLAYQI